MQIKISPYAKIHILSECVVFFSPSTTEDPPTYNFVTFNIYVGVYVYRCAMYTHTYTHTLALKFLCLSAENSLLPRSFYFSLLSYVRINREIVVSILDSIARLFSSHLRTKFSWDVCSIFFEFWRVNSYQIIRDFFDNISIYRTLVDIEFIRLFFPGRRFLFKEPSHRKFEVLSEIKQAPVSGL